jgi:hypothetical protein
MMIARRAKKGGVILPTSKQTKRLLCECFFPFFRKDSQSLVRRHTKKFQFTLVTTLTGGQWYGMVVPTTTTTTLQRISNLTKLPLPYHIMVATTTVLWCYIRVRIRFLLLPKRAVEYNDLMLH